MLRYYFVIALFLISSKSLLAQTNNADLDIIPAPKSIKINSGTFLISRESTILYDSSEDLLIANLFHDYLKEVYFLDVPVAKNFAKEYAGVISFSSKNFTNSNPESYGLTVSNTQINVSGKGAGLFYGLQTLMQLCPLKKEATVKIQCAEISDEPRYKYRGLHLDVGRHIFPISFIKKYIDITAQYKLNTFHWHLTEDQGWRIEIKKYPKLTQIGAYRDQTLLGNNYDRVPQVYDNTPYGGFYTQEEVREIVAYATSKFVTVIPEIEMPGHSLGVLAAYPELGCGDKPGPYKVAQKWGVFDDVFCAGKEETFTFLQDVLTEVIALFPSQYIHIGGDECPKTKWKTCRFCQKRIRDHKLKNEHELQSYFIQRMEKFVNSKGRKIIGWDEILEGGLAPNATVMSWTGIEGGIAAAKQNHDAIMTPGNFVYFDHVQGRSDQEPLSIGGNTVLQEVYSYDPTPASLTPAQQTHIIGVQANVWTEYMQTPAKVEYMILPRALALAEIAWTALDRKDYKNFSEERLPYHLARLDSYNTLYRVPTALKISDTTYLGAKFTVPLSPSVTGSKIFYTLDGYTPGETEILYEKPIEITVPANDRRVLKTIVITPSGKRSAITTTNFVNADPLPASPSVVSENGLKYYLVPGLFKNAADVDTVKATEMGVTSAINLVKFKPRGRTFGLVYDGYLNLLEDGVYTFSTSSDDGSQLYIDDNLIVDNDSKHAVFQLTSSVNLLKGFHKLRIKYFQAGGSGELRVYMAEPGQSKHELPAGILFH